MTDTKPSPEIRALIKTLLTQERFAVLNTIGDPWPYPSLVAFLCRADFHGIYFYTEKQTSKFTNLQRNPAVSLLIDNRGRPQVDLASTSALTAFGRVEISGPAETPALDQAFSRRHHELASFCQASETAACLIRVEQYSLVHSFGRVCRCRPAELIG